MDPAQPVPGNLIVGRRPVFDTQLEVAGYTLGLCRGGATPVDDGEVLTTDVAARHAGSADWDRFRAVKPLFVKPSPRFLTGEEGLPLDAGHTVVRLDAAAAGAAGVVEGCRRLVSDGFRLALDDLDRLDPSCPLIELASFARVDFAAMPTPGLRVVMGRAASCGLRTVAVGVDDETRMTLARHSGFDLFEGRLLARPLSALPDALTPARLTVLRMIETVNDPKTSAADLQRVVEADAGLSYRLLHISGLGASGGLRRPVRSVREATVLLGREWIYRWLVLMLVADANRGAPEQIGIAMTRARMAELIAGRAGGMPPDASFTVGLVSALDLVLCAPLTDIVSKLAITEDLVTALLSRRGALGGVLSDVLAWEAGCPPGSPASGVPLLDLEQIHVEAVAWADGLGELLGDADRAA